MEINQIPEGWKMTTLGEVAEINELTIDKNYPYKTIEYIDIASVNTRDLGITQKLNLLDAPSRAKRIIRDCDTLISTVRPNLKHFCYIKKAKPNYVASTGFAVISSKTSDSKFIYYLLTTNEYTDYLTKVADSQTSTYPAFNAEIITSSKFLLPPLPEQKAIAEVLSSLDNKIELLREQNQTLEAIAQAIFKEWFVNFNFPTTNGKPYRSSGGPLIDSELGPIPEGWRVGKLGEIIDVKDGTHDSPKPSSTGHFLITSRHLLQSGLDFKNSYLISEEDFNQINRRSKVDRFDILISMIGTVGLLYFVLEDEIDFAIKNVGLFKTSQKKELAEYIYLFLQSAEGIQRIQSSIAGTTQAYVTLETLRNIRITIPDDPIIINFNEASRSIFSKIHNNQSQIQTLSTLRDELLPKLMKGEIRVKDFYKI